MEALLCFASRPLSCLSLSSSFSLAHRSGVSQLVRSWVVALEGNVRPPRRMCCHLGLDNI